MATLHTRTYSSSSSSRSPSPDARFWASDLDLFGSSTSRRPFIQQTDIDRSARQVPITPTWIAAAESGNRLWLTFGAVPHERMVGLLLVDAPAASKRNGWGIGLW